MHPKSHTRTILFLKRPRSNVEVKCQNTGLSHDVWMRKNEGASFMVHDCWILSLTMYHCGNKAYNNTFVKFSYSSCYAKPNCRQNTDNCMTFYVKNWLASSDLTLAFLVNIHLKTTSSCFVEFAIVVFDVYYVSCMFEYWYDSVSLMIAIFLLTKSCISLYL